MVVNEEKLTFNEFPFMQIRSLLAIIIFFSFTYTAHSQFTDPTKWAIYAGPQATTVRYVVKDEKQDNSFKIGFQVGLTTSLPVEGNLRFSPGIAYNLRGYKVDFDTPVNPPDSSALDVNTTFHTIELSFLFHHVFKQEPGRWFIKFGPSLDFALFGNEKFKTTNGSVDRKMRFSFDNYGRYMASAILQLGYESKSGIFGFVHYNYSLTTMNNFDGGPRIGNRAIGISLGKIF